MQLVFSPFACCSALQLPCTRQILDRAAHPAHPIWHLLRPGGRQSCRVTNLQSNERPIPANACQCSAPHASTPQHAQTPSTIQYKLLPGLRLTGVTSVWVFFWNEQRQASNAHVQLANVHFHPVWQRSQGPTPNQSELRLLAQKFRL
jgi:hypothetical protein